MAHVKIFIKDTLFARACVACSLYTSNTSNLCDTCVDYLIPVTDACYFCGRELRHENEHIACSSCYGLYMIFERVFIIYKSNFLTSHLLRVIQSKDHRLLINFMVQVYIDNIVNLHISSIRLIMSLDEQHIMDRVCDEISRKLYLTHNRGCVLLIALMPSNYKAYNSYINNHGLDKYGDIFILSLFS